MNNLILRNLMIDYKICPFCGNETTRTTDTDEINGKKIDKFLCEGKYCKVFTFYTDNDNLYMIDCKFFSEGQHHSMAIDLEENYIFIDSKLVPCEEGTINMITKNIKFPIDFQKFMGNIYLLMFMK